MKKYKYGTSYLIFVISLCVIFVGCFIACVFVICNMGADSKHVHVHFIDTNECYDVKSTWAQNGIVWVTFNDKSTVKVGANNVVVFVDHVCDYCGK